MNQRFNSLTAELINKRKAVHELCRQYARSPSKGNLKRVRGLFAQCGEQVIIEAGFHMDYGDHVYLGDRVYINANCIMLDSVTNFSVIDANNQPTHAPNKAITIGDDCMIGPNVQFLSVTHDTDPIQRLEHKYNYAQSITLGNNVWLGGGVIVLGGVTIGDNSVVGAGSVVTKNIEPNCVYVGNPAIKIRNL
ncbi:sugar O-acetyltransferase [Colwellia sp. D2M02]|uniref:sugar O-acetyltransferase n=1 Tax=Colwellia sp. D2M02 TaxID=2841562 RepID=UPI001C08CC5C|nr:sugar O-acetyltransferase [Colwellia sp. D2M02]MBU2892459.1 sugar O-acetyltransferase [Colwellia sp. D2M02]